MINTNYPLENTDRTEKTASQPTQNKDKQKAPVATLHGVDTALSFGFILVIPQLAGVFFGLYLDNKFGTKPILTIIFLTMGLILGIAAMVRKVKKDF